MCAVFDSFTHWSNGLLVPQSRCLHFAVRDVTRKYNNISSVSKRRFHSAELAKNWDFLFGININILFAVITHSNFKTMTKLLVNPMEYHSNAESPDENSDDF